jgi:8-oxo-dGTP diphosphatase
MVLEGRNNSKSDLGNELRTPVIPIARLHLDLATRYSPSMQHYACGFLFSTDRSRVLLIRKNRPAWQAGKLNGVGGKLEAGESPLDAMRREFREEAGLRIDDWRHVLSLVAETWAGHFFCAFGPIDQARAITDEALEIHPVTQLPNDTIPNLHWIIPLMLDPDAEDGDYRVEFQSGRQRPPRNPTL